MAHGLKANELDDIRQYLHVGRQGGVKVDEEQMKRIIVEVLNRPNHCPGCQGNCEGIKK